MAGEKLKFMKLPRLLLPLLLLPGITAVAAPFEADEGTLLLAGFDHDIHHADYAGGWDSFSGGGYGAVEGYYGRAVDLRGVKLSDDFWKMDNAYLPHFTQWVFWPRGNVHFTQGTLEFWFRVAPSDTKYAVIGGGDTIHFQAFQPLRPQADGNTATDAPKENKLRHIQPYIRLSASNLSWKLVTLGGKELDGKISFSKIPGWNKPLNPEQWHHFALQWSPDGVTISIDGRLVGSHELHDDYGLALTAAPNRGLALAGIILDEFRISDHPRHTGDFEPNWKNAQRPPDAFPGVAGIIQPSWKSHAVNRPLPIPASTATAERTEQLRSWALKFDEQTGALLQLGLHKADAAGLMLWRGVERSPLSVVSKNLHWSQNTNDAVSFVQEWQDGLRVHHNLSVGEKGQLRWNLELENQGKDALWLEALMGIPVMKNTTEFFDMSWRQTQLQFPRRRDEYVYSLPFVAASDGKSGLGVGLDAHQAESALIGEWLPGDPSIRQGTRVALNPGEKQTLNFVILASGGDFGALDALAAYHGLFPDLYTLNANVPVYSYLGVCQHFPYVNIPDLTRQYYVGGQWGHGPYFTKGDYLGTAGFWDRADLKDDPSYQHARGNAKRYKTPENLKQEIIARSRDAFDNYYTPRRSHDVPNLTPRFLVDEYMPGIDFPDDPLTAGQYYMQNLIVNEYCTPLGYKFMDDQENTMRLIAQYSPGFINDVCQSSSMRFTDAYARQSPGRAFSADRGEYLVAAAGHQQRYEMINGFSDHGHQQSMISDGGVISYTLGAYSAAYTFESGNPFISTTSMQAGLAASRNLLGEKPNSVLTSYGLDDIGAQFQPGDFTPGQLRDYYRYAFRRLMLTALETGYYADPPLLHGKQWGSEVNPILVESLVRGRKIISAGKTDAPFWLIRGGEDQESIFIAGNSTAQNQTGDIRILPHYFSGNWIWAPYFGGVADQLVNPGETLFKNLVIPAHDIAAFKPVAEYAGDLQGHIAAAWGGDGLELEVKLSLELQQGGKIRMVAPAEYYAVTKVRLNGSPVEPDAEGFVTLAKGKSELRAALKNTVLKFSSKDWGKVDLLKGGQTNFAILGSRAPGYEHGTASQLTWFLRQYDEEDGILGNLKDAEIYENEAEVSSDFTGWLVDARISPMAQEAAVELDAGKHTLRMIGRTAGEVRRAMMLFMRLVDRKYPHIGRHVPMDRNLREGWKSPDWTEDFKKGEPGWKRLYGRRSQTLDFFEKFADKNFLYKPILERTLEDLYSNDNSDFAGKYKIAVSPYIFEPTFSDNYIYGYSVPSAHR